MKTIFSILVSMLLAVTAFSQQFRLVGNPSGFPSQVNDSTYTLSVDFASDQTGNGFLPTQIDSTFRMFFQNEKVYQIDSVANATFSSADLWLVEYGETDGQPSGQGLVYDPQGRETVPQTPANSAGASPVLNAAISTYNLQFVEEAIFLKNTIDIGFDSTTYSDILIDDRYIYAATFDKSSVEIFDKYSNDTVFVQSTENEFGAFYSTHLAKYKGFLWVLCRTSRDVPNDNALFIFEIADDGSLTQTFFQKLPDGRYPTGIAFGDDKFYYGSLSRTDMRVINSQGNALVGGVIAFSKRTGYLDIVKDTIYAGGRNAPLEKGEFSILVFNDSSSTFTTLSSILLSETEIVGVKKYKDVVFLYDREGVMRIYNIKDKANPYVLDSINTNVKLLNPRFLEYPAPSTVKQIGNLVFFSTIASNEIAVFDLKTGAFVMKFEAGKAGIQDFYIDGNTIVTANSDTDLQHNKLEKSALISPGVFESSSVQTSSLLDPGVVTYADLDGNLTGSDVLTFDGLGITTKKSDFDFAQFRGGNINIYGATAGGVRVVQRSNTNFRAPIFRTDRHRSDSTFLNAGFDVFSIDNYGETSNPSVMISRIQTKVQKGYEANGNGYSSMKFQVNDMDFLELGKDSIFANFPEPANFNKFIVNYDPVVGTQLMLADTVRGASNGSVITGNFPRDAGGTDTLPSFGSSSMHGFGHNVAKGGNTYFTAIYGYDNDLMFNSPKNTMIGSKLDLYGDNVFIGGYSASLGNLTKKSAFTNGLLQSSSATGSGSHFLLSRSANVDIEAGLAFGDDMDDVKGVESAFFLSDKNLNLDSTFVFGKAYHKYQFPGSFANPLDAIRATFTRTGDTWQQRHIDFTRSFQDTSITIGHLSSSYPENNNSYLILEGRSGLQYAPTAWLPNGSVAINKFHGSYGRGSWPSNQTASLMVNSPDYPGLDTLNILDLTVGNHGSPGVYNTKMSVDKSGNMLLDGDLNIGDDIDKSRSLTIKSNSSDVFLYEYGSSPVAPRFRFYKSRGTEESPTAINNSTGVGGITFNAMGNDGNFFQAGIIDFLGKPDATEGGFGILQLRVMDSQLTGTAPVQLEYRGETDGFDFDANVEIEKDCTIEGSLYLNAAKTLGIFHGTGTPEGNLTADVGSTFHRTDGGAGTSYYVKESGTGNTGWVAK